MMRYLKVALCFIFVISFVGEVFGILCWTCNSELDPRCGDPFDNRTLPMTNCARVEGISANNNPHVCYTIKRKVNGVVSYVRGCGFANDLFIGADTPCAVQSTPSFYQEYCPCSDLDLCNRST